MGVLKPMTSWMLDDLTFRTQFVKMQSFIFFSQHNKLQHRCITRNSFGLFSFQPTIYIRMSIWRWLVPYCEVCRWHKRRLIMMIPYTMLTTSINLDYWLLFVIDLYRLLQSTIFSNEISLKPRKWSSPSKSRNVFLTLSLFLTVQFNRSILIKKRSCCDGRQA